MFLYLSLAILLSSSSYNNAFTINTKLPSLTPNTISRTSSILSLAGESEEEAKKPIVKSVYKEIKYDESTGRFFETKDECDPEDEYCVVDSKTGDMIRLTLEEKERIFLDSLQVRLV